MTDPEFADATYIEPITPEFVEQVIAAERPDALLATLGGQTALNTAVALHENGVLERYGVELIGADIEAIQRGEDRLKFKEIVQSVGGEVPRSAVCHSMDEVRAAVAELGLPVVIRPSFTMGGLGSGHGPRPTPTWTGWPAPGWPRRPVHEVLIEESVLGWKEYELELMRDRTDNVVVVCSIENLDPMGVHTGDSITVAPAMTLTDREYQHMRDVGIAVLRAVGVDTGGCNIQFAVHPDTGRLVVIEMNPRVSRSSRAGVQGHRVPDRQDRRQAGHRLHPRRDPQRHHRRDPGRVRADAGLRRGQGAAVRLREVPRRRPRADHHHEERRRGDGARPLVPGGAGQGAALDGDRGRPGSGPGPTPTTRLVHEPDVCARRPTAGSTPSSGRCAPGPRSTEVAAASGIDPWFVDQIARLVELRAEIARRAGAGRAAAAPGQAGRAVRPADRRAAPGARRRGRGAHAAPPARHPPGVQDRRHLRGRVRRPHARTTTAPTRPTPRRSPRSRRRPSGRR